VLLCVLAYPGVRPGEALALTWGDVGERTLLVERSLGADGSVNRTKTGQIRSVRLMAPLREDLDASRNGAAAGELMFPTRFGTGWDEDDWRNGEIASTGPRLKRRV
jgi:integrase